MKKVRQEDQGKKTRRRRSKDKRTEAGVSYNSISPHSAPPKNQEQPRVQKSLGGGGELKWIPTNSPANQAITSGSLQVEVATNSKLGTATDRVIGETRHYSDCAKRAAKE
ncbi:hypothetical protein F2Q69_00017621 [Brassica cretica]|uniref:Uncharacterized protein n=1 Tax=Brassica cretica TaxID=69181 RepID=A0A8S9R6K3_BRACR|nr:hypothetical protein F2Q69_00017621 [Brassica cretica]